MSHEKVSNEKSGKKAPAKNLTEKRAAKAAKRDEKKAGFNFELAAPVSKTRQWHSFVFFNNSNACYVR